VHPRVKPAGKTEKQVKSFQKTVLTCLFVFAQMKFEASPKLSGCFKHKS